LKIVYVSHINNLQMIALNKLLILITILSKVALQILGIFER